jgi:hypothetical protein
MPWTHKYLKLAHDEYISTGETNHIGTSRVIFNGVLTVVSIKSSKQSNSKGNIQTAGQKERENKWSERTCCGNSKILRVIKIEEKPAIPWSYSGKGRARAARAPR